jgi:DNA-binding response OmpR family regulator
MTPSGLILVVETNDLIRDLLERWLKEAGYRVEFRRPPQTDEILYQGEAPCLIIVDVPRPRPGEDVIRTIRGTYAGPILALSGRFRRGLDQSDDVAERIGANRVLPKPFSRKELLATVVEAMKSSR